MRFLVTCSARDVGIVHPVVAIYRNINPKADASVYDEAIAALTSRIEEIREKKLTTPEVLGYRTLYTKLGYPGITTAGERLLNICSEKGFGRFGPLVDAYNLVALNNVEGLGCHDVSSLDRDATLIFRRATGGEKIFVGSNKKPSSIPQGDLTYGFDLDGTFTPLAWLGKKDSDNAKYRLTEDSKAMLLTAIGNEATSQEYNETVCHDVFENLKKSCPDVEMELLVGEFIEEPSAAGSSAS